MDPYIKPQRYEDIFFYRHELSDAPNQLLSQGVVQEVQEDGCIVLSNSTRFLVGVPYKRCFYNKESAYDYKFKTLYYKPWLDEEIGNIVEKRIKLTLIKKIKKLLRIK